MKSLLFSFFLLVLLLINHIGYNQTVDKYWQDGKVVFQFKLSYDIDIHRFKDNAYNIRSLEFIRDVVEYYGITKAYFLHPKIKDKRLKNTVEIEFTEIYKIDEFISYLNGFEFIEYAEPKDLHYPSFTPNDYYYDSEHQWNLFKINASQAWSISKGSSDIVVAVTDDAFLTSHPELVNKWVPGYDVVEGTSNVNPVGAVTGNHGTHLAGIVGAKTNNIIGIASIGFNISIMPVKITRNSDGAFVGGFDGIIWAADNGADVINMSWSIGIAGGSYGQNVCNYAWEQGCILVAASGNNSTGIKRYPAAYDNVIAVASTSRNDTKSTFSNFGSWIDICAPGEEILSCNAQSTFTTASGTSTAAPLVSGLLGLMKSANPSLSNSELIDCLFSSADNIDAQNSLFINRLGSGRINAYEALQCVTVPVTDLIPKIINKRISVFPNPTKDNIYIKSPDIINEIIVRNILGKTILSIEPNQNEMEINLSEFESGIYLIKILTTNRTSVHKIQKI